MKKRGTMRTITVTKFNGAYSSVTAHAVMTDRSSTVIVEYYSNGKSWAYVKSCQCDDLALCGVMRNSCCQCEGAFVLLKKIFDRISRVNGDFFMESMYYGKQFSASDFDEGSWKEV